jgi:hypothetical protein
MATSGPIAERGQLDLTLAKEEDSMFYECTGVDVAGANASQLFSLSSNHNNLVRVEQMPSLVPKPSPSPPTNQKAWGRG